MPIECLRGRAAPCGPGPPAGGTGSPAEAVVNAYRVPAGDGSPLWPRPTSCPPVQANSVFALYDVPLGLNRRHLTLAAFPLIFF